jgi:hypothetical protein
LVAVAFGGFSVIHVVTNCNAVVSWGASIDLRTSGVTTGGGGSDDATVLYVLIMDQITNRHGFLDVFMPVRSSGSMLIMQLVLSDVVGQYWDERRGRFPILWAAGA